MRLRIWQRVLLTAAWLLVAAAAHAKISTVESVRIPLTDGEREWIRAHPVVRVITLDDYAPYLISDDKGELVGLSVNLIDLIAQRTGLRFEYHRHQNVASAMAEFKSGGGDVLPALAHSREREDFALFSEPYAEAFSVIVTRMNAPYLNSLQELNGLRIGSLRGAVQSQLIRVAAPNARVVEYNTVQEGLVALAKGEVDATYASVGTAAYYIKHLQLANLRLGSVVGTPMSLHVGIRKDWPELVGIINKALASVTPTERKQLDDQWIFVAQAPNKWLPWLRIAAIVAAVASAVAVFLWYFSRRMARELAERKRIQLELEETHRALARVSEEKSNMMSSIAHDLRSPITGIILSNQLLEMKIGASDLEAREMIASQREACRKMIARVDELVSPQTLESGQRELKWQKLDLVALVRETIRDHAPPAASKGITLELRCEATEAFVISDRGALRHVTDNLLSNAIKYSPLQSRVVVDLKPGPGGCLLAVTDQGPGVKPEEREAIFERFRRGSAQPTAGEKSSGLGLWIVRRTLQDLHGRVWCEAGPGGSGSTFSVFVPPAPPR
jgi:two-component system sensor histidine kinase EvgS